MDNETIRQFCLGLPHVTEKIQWGEDLVFKVGGKMFAVLNISPGHARNRISFKSTQEESAELVERDGIIPAPYMARAWWVALDSFNTMRPKELQGWLARAHQLIYEKLPKKLRQELEVSYKDAARAHPKKNKAARAWSIPPRAAR
jgi:predicted DNA-binding protein (MmcQ/YjbR family)